MKLAIRTFLIFLVIDIILFIISITIHSGKEFIIIFLPAIFIEIAIYGSLILNEVAKIKEDHKE